MKVLDAFSDQVSSHAAVAAEATANTGGCIGVLSAGWDSVGTPSEGAVSDPSLLAVGWSDPNASLFGAVNDQKRPLRLELCDVLVGNGLGLDRIHHNKVVISENQFWTNPQQGCCGGDCACDSNVEGKNTRFGWVENRLAQVEGVESDGYVTPDEVAFWAINVDVLHKPIIAGVPAGGEGK